MEKSTNYLERMMEEQAELCSRIKKLEAALQNPEKFNLDKTQIDLLSAQMSAMVTYMNILQLRIEDEMILSENKEEENEKSNIAPDRDSCKAKCSCKSVGANEEDDDDDEGDNEDDDGDYIEMDLSNLIDLGNIVKNSIDELSKQIADMFKKYGKFTPEMNELFERNIQLHSYLNTITRCIEDYVTAPVDDEDYDDEYDDDESGDGPDHISVNIPDDCPMKEAFIKMAKSGDSFRVTTDDDE